ncbi:MAG: hypothetical protein H6618_09350 [Deltaproteobacteria bacterium]|nr:hypothetical protein [Deltaproteobacteria bacterium]
MVCSLSATNVFADDLKIMQAALGRVETSRPEQEQRDHFLQKPVKPLPPTLVSEENPKAAYGFIRGGLIKEYKDEKVRKEAQRKNKDAQEDYDRNMQIYEYKKAEYDRKCVPNQRKTDYEALDLVRDILADHHVWERIEDDQWKIYLIALCAHNRYKALAPEDMKVSGDFLDLIARTVKLIPEDGDDKEELLDKILEEKPSSVFPRVNNFVIGHNVKFALLNMTGYSRNISFNIFMDELNARINSAFGR